MPRVYFDSQVFRCQGVGGASRYYAELIKLLPRFGVSPVTYLGMTWNRHAIEAGIASDMSKYQVLDSSTARRGVAGVNKLVDRLCLRFGHFDIIHRTLYERPTPTNVGQIAACTVLDMIPERLPAYFPVGNPHRFKRQVVDSSDLIFSISESTTHDLIDLYKCDASRVVTVPLGIDPIAFSLPCIDANPFPRPYVLFVGSRRGYKNFDRFAQAVMSIMKRNRDLNLAIVGGGALSGVEKKLFLENEMLNRVFQLNAPETILGKIYREAELFVFPSEYEGFGLPLLEAFAAGCPVAASNASSFPEVGGKAIEYFDPKSVEAIRQAIETILEHSSRASALRHAGAEQVRKFPLANTAELTARAYYGITRIGS
jgi:glycosyltransferase involved in cell wall biosynthesis